MVACHDSKHPVTGYCISEEWQSLIRGLSYPNTPVEIRTPCHLYPSTELLSTFLAPTAWKVGRPGWKLGGLERHLLTRVSWHFAIFTTDGTSAVNFNKKSEPMHPPPSQTGWLITIGAVQHIWRKVSEEHKFRFVETRNLNQDALENAFGAICLHCGSNSNPSAGRFVDALKTVIINGLAYRSLHGTNCEDDGASLLDKLHSFLKPSNDSSTSPSTSHDNELHLFASVQ
jgi:hypothetical protein